MRSVCTVKIQFRSDRLGRRNAVPFSPAFGVTKKGVPNLSAYLKPSDIFSMNCERRWILALRRRAGRTVALGSERWATAINADRSRLNDTVEENS
jgi:hypothetical protein